MPRYEDNRVMAVQVDSMKAAVEIINVTESAHLLLQIVPAHDGVWVLFKDDSLLHVRLASLTPRPFPEIVRPTSWTPARSSVPA